MHFVSVAMMTRIWKSKELTNKTKIKIYEMIDTTDFPDQNVGQCKNKMRKGFLQQKLVGYGDRRGY